MDYTTIRNKILSHLLFLHNKGISYQDICNYVNKEQTDFHLYKDFFTRFRSKSTYYKGAAKREKLNIIQQCIERLYNQNLDEEEDVHQHLKKLIHDALICEFDTYAAVNRSQQSPKQLSYFFDQKKSAYLAIENNIKHKEQYNWVLDIENRGSNFKLLSMEIDSLFSTNAVVKTHEYWKVCWVDQKSNQPQYNFEAINNQTYLLTKNQEGWLIIENMYNSTNSKIRPEFIDYETIRNLAKDNPSKLLSHATYFLANNQLLHFLELIRIGDFKLNKKQHTLLSKTQESYSLTHRLLNTKVTDLNTYKQEMSQLRNKLQPLLISLFDA